MRRIAAFGSVLLASSVISACASTASTRSTVLSETATAPRPEVRVSSVAVGSRVVEEVALHAGPRVSIRAEVSNEADSRRVRGIFRVDDDAYVIVGHIDADGVLRIAFPSNPSDDGFVRGNRSYQTNEFFAGFDSQYRFRARTTSIWNTVAAQDAYDGGFGYVFVIASWRPMRFDRFSDGYGWDTFDLVSDQYMNDPRPAIQELASRLAGDNGDSYTIQFARYTNTEVIYSDYNTIASAYSPYNVGYCSGYAPLGFTSFGYGRYGYPYHSGFNYNFWYRGTGYYYDSFGDCYRPYAPWGAGFGYRIVQVPVITPPRSQPRILDVTGHRPPPKPEPPPAHFMPLPTSAAPGEAKIEHRSAPEYRPRTDAGDNGNATGPARRQPRIETPRTENPRIETPRAENPRIETPRAENPRIETPRPDAPPRSEPPRTAVPRSEAARPQPSRAESPKTESRPEPPRAAAPRSEPAKPPETRKPPR